MSPTVFFPSTLLYHPVSGQARKTWLREEFGKQRSWPSPETSKGKRLDGRNSEGSAQKRKLSQGKEPESGWTQQRGGEDHPQRPIRGLPPRVGGCKKSSMRSWSPDGHHSRAPAWATAQVTGWGHGRLWVHKHPEAERPASTMGHRTSASADNLRPSSPSPTPYGQGGAKQHSKEGETEEQGRQMTEPPASCSRFPSSKSGVQRRSVKQDCTVKRWRRLFLKLNLDFRTLKNEFTRGFFVQKQGRQIQHRTLTGYCERKI